MNVTTLTNLIKGRLARFTGSSSKLDPYILNELQAAQGRLEISAWLPAFLRARSVLTVSSETFSLPADCLRLDDTEECPIQILIQGKYEMLRRETSEFARLYYSSEVGEPKSYVVEGDEVYLYPPPNQDYTIRLKYFKAEPQLSESVVSNKWTVKAGELLMSEAGVVLATGYLANQEATALFESLRQRVQRELQHADAARDLAGRTEADD